MFHIHRLRGLVLALGLQAAFASPAPAAEAPALPRQISLETDCNGCPAGLRLVLRADDTWELHSVGKARLGTADTTRQARASPGTFAAVARQILAPDVAQLAADYSNPGLQDGRWQLLRIEHADGRVQQVFRRGVAGPAALSGVIDAMTAAAHKAGLDYPSFEGSVDVFD